MGFETAHDNLRFASGFAEARALAERLLAEAENAHPGP
jgi:hypothetical protein